MKNFIAFLFLLLSPAYSSSITLHSLPGDSTDLMFYDNDERLLQDNETDAEDSDLMDHLEDLRRRPVDLNSADIDKLSSVPYISPSLARSILQFRFNSGGFASKRQLLKVDGIDEQLYSLISPYVFARKKNRLSGKRQQLPEGTSFSAIVRMFTLMDLQKKAGFTTGKYQGPNMRNSARVLAKFNTGSSVFLSGIAIDRDPGEKSLTDFAAGYIAFQSSSIVRTVIAGDYKIAFGSGLALSNSYSSPKTTETAMNRKHGSRLKPYASAGEYGFFRGVAVNLKTGPADAFLLYSSRHLDATVDTLTGEIRTIYSDGYHRTETEVSRRGRLHESLLGARAEYTNGTLKYGAVMFKTSYSPGLNNDTLKKLYGLSGSGNFYWGFDLKHSLGFTQMMLEVAKSGTGAPACIAGLNLSAPGRSAEAVLLYRRYPYDFFSPYSTALSERSYAYNETGFLAGLRVKPIAGLTLSSYFDIYSFPYRTYSVSVPSRGNDFVLSADFRIRSGLLLNFRYKNETKEESISGGFFGVRNQKNLRAGIIIQEKNVRLRCRYEYCLVTYNNFAPSAKGSLFFTDVGAKLKGLLSISARFIFFDTKNYDSRIYEFENEISGVMTNKALYGNGMRWYVVAAFQPFTNVKAEAKYSETFLHGSKSIGSGNDQITGDTTERFALGLTISF